MSVKKGVIEWRDIVEFPEWEVNSRGEVRTKLTMRSAEKIVVGQSYCYLLRRKGKEYVRPIRPIMRATFPEVNFK